MKLVGNLIVAGVFVFMHLFVNGCKSEEPEINEVKIEVSQHSFSVNAEAQTVSLTIETLNSNWEIVTELNWVTFSETNGEAGTTKILIDIEENESTIKRNGNVTIAGTDAEKVSIIIEQAALEVNLSKQWSTAEELAEKISIGWNIGNTMEAIGGETAWGNPKITQELINAVKVSGFNAIRIPCSWDSYILNEQTNEIDINWLNRVEEVIQYCIDLDMYILLNIHWDGGWLENNCTKDKETENKIKQTALWSQIASHLEHFDERLLFASANEPNVDDSEQMEVLNSYHQSFINAVRATGGNNEYRVLVVQGPSTDIEKTNRLMKNMPSDTVDDRLMVEVHFYTPWNFCGLESDADWGKAFYYWGKENHSSTDTDHNPTWGEESTIDQLFGLMKKQFVDKGIPVLMGEYGAIRRSSLQPELLEAHLASRAYYLKYVTQQMKANGILPFYWDNGGNDNNSFGIFNRVTNAVFDQQALDALIEGVQ